MLGGVQETGPMDRAALAEARSSPVAIAWLGRPGDESASGRPIDRHPPLDW